MTLADIAAGIEVVDEQRDRGVATVDDTGGDLADALSDHEADLPCSAEEAAGVLSAYADGESVGAAGHEAGVVPVTAAKVLHLVGMDGVSPLGPTARRIVRDWLSAEVSRAEARELTGASEREFALAAFVESHDPLAGTGEIRERVFAADANAAVEKRDRLSETMSDVDDLL